MAKRAGLTLDFNQTKKAPMLNGILSSPDLCKVNTPDLEKLLLGANTMINTPTPSAVAQTTTILFPKTVTEEQENFSAGFMDALNNLHNSNSQASDSSNVYTDVDQSNQYMPTIKEEPQTVPNIKNSPPVSPVDMEHQEKIKLERKRMRNRLAASKCRTRKLERISKLEERVKLLKGENNDLAHMITQLREHVSVLKEEVLEHVHHGCQIMVV